jgi:hypothetical protein
MELEKERGGTMDAMYEAPQVKLLGSVQKLTEGDLDKIGSIDDILTPTVPLLDGEILPD